MLVSLIDTLDIRAILLSNFPQTSTIEKKY